MLRRCAWSGDPVLLASSVVQMLRVGPVCGGWCWFRFLLRRGACCQVQCRKPQQCVFRICAFVVLSGTAVCGGQFFPLSGLGGLQKNGFLCVWATRSFAVACQHVLVVVGCARFRASIFAIFTFAEFVMGCSCGLSGGRCRRRCQMRAFRSRSWQRDLEVVCPRCCGCGGLCAGGGICITQSIFVWSSCTRVFLVLAR